MHLRSNTILKGTESHNGYQNHLSEVQIQLGALDPPQGTRNYSGQSGYISDIQNKLGHHQQQDFKTYLRGLQQNSGHPDLVYGCRLISESADQPQETQVLLLNPRST